MTTLSFFHWLIDKAILGYIISSLVFFVLTLFSRKTRGFTPRYFNISNALLLFVLLANLVLLVCEIALCRSWFSSEILGNEGEIPEYFLKGSPFHILYILFFGSFFHLFFLKKLVREKVFPTVISIILLYGLLNEQKMTSLILSFARGYLPSSWSSTFKFVDIGWNMGFSVVYFGVSWLCASKRRSGGDGA